MNTGQIVKAKYDKWTSVPNSMIQDKDLSWKAKGLLCYLLSLPDDWVIHKTELCNHSKDGRDATISGFDELDDAGYVLSVEIRNELGHFQGFNYIVYASKQVNQLPIPENPKSVNPISEKPEIQRKHSTNETLNSDQPEIQEKTFESFRKMYGGAKRGLKTEFENFKKKHKDWRDVLPSLPSVIRDQCIERKIATSAGRFVPEWKNLSTWINQRCWETESPNLKEEIKTGTKHTEYSVNPSKFWGTEIPTRR
jgi:hypothetical protein